MLPLHNLLVDVVHKILLPRKQKQTEANYLDITRMELLLSKKPTNLPQLMLCHMRCIYVRIKMHSLGYGFWLGDIFEFLHIHPLHDQWSRPRLMGRLVKVPSICEVQDTEAKPLRKDHGSDKLHLPYKVEHAGWIEENDYLKGELLKSKTTLEIEQSLNSTYLKGLFELLKTHPTLFPAPSPSSKLP
ncbi:hypothetical protein H5410_037317 [Solanum commersonii]|uniref:Uncharacterized protein n=1 Tax=Solanum commersonii TaxID=4109 RepID=A0A9J5Y7G2_SOLCO|nr:hypothetical protein H5410_037317 [Solanum commersonii]